MTARDDAGTGRAFLVGMKSLAYELTRCIVCDSADGREIAGADDVRAEVERLWEFHTRRLRPDTPPPRLMDRVAFSEDPPIRIVQCAGCGFVYRNPIERRFELEATYAAGAVSPDVLAALYETQRPAYKTQAKRLLRALGRRGSGLEVGSYAGGFLAAARAVGMHFEGLDVNPQANVFARSQGFAVADGDLVSFETDRTFDAVAIWNTFDQLPDPRAAAYAAWKLVRPGGTLAIRVPNGAFYAKLRTMAGTRLDLAARVLLAHNNLLTFPYRFGFTPASIALLLERVGFATQRIYGDVLVPVADEWTRGWAKVEERAVKQLLRVVARRTLEWAPWIEVYAVRSVGAAGRRSV